MIKVIIFDLDGTLYKFKGGCTDFYKTGIFEEVRQRGIQFLAKRLGVPEEEAAQIWKRIKEDYNNDISIGIEQEFGISRYVYFDTVWDIDAANYVEKNDELRLTLESIPAKKVLLTNAPKVWAKAVLKQLGLADTFNDLFFGEGNIRKPAREAYMQITKALYVKPSEMLMVGNDEDEDLRVAKELEIKTVLIGEKSEFADACIPCIKELPSIISKLAAGEQ